MVALYSPIAAGLLPSALAAVLLMAPLNLRAGENGSTAAISSATVSPAVLPALTYGRDIPLPQATYMYREAVMADLVVVFKSRRELHLMNRGEVVGTYRVALGRNPKGHKLQEGDGRTPEGVYTLNWRNPNSRFHRSIHVSFPRQRDRDRAERLGMRPGQHIMIHGLPNGHGPEAVGHPYLDWTDGCIAVTNEEMDEIWERVADGTTIIIYP
jgi:murein L,D-transpeptidase YafK